jgi:hypothetical protein
MYSQELSLTTRFPNQNQYFIFVGSKSLPVKNSENTIIYFSNSTSTTKAIGVHKKGMCSHTTWNASPSLLQTVNYHWTIYLPLITIDPVNWSPNGHVHTGNLDFYNHFLIWQKFFKISTLITNTLFRHQFAQNSIFSMKQKQESFPLSSINILIKQ